MTGAAGLVGKSWPDSDMLPLGWLTDPGSNEGPHRNGRLTLNEQRTQMTLWSMSRSPLMFGGDMRKLDNNTLDLITHPALLEINSFSSNNMEFQVVKATTDAAVGSIRSRIAKGRDGRIYLAYFNLNEEKTVMSSKVSDVKNAVGLSSIQGGGCFGKDIWSGSMFGPKEESISTSVESHRSALFILSCNKF